MSERDKVYYSETKTEMVLVDSEIDIVTTVGTMESGPPGTCFRLSYVSVVPKSVGVFKVCGNPPRRVFWTGDDGYGRFFDVSQELKTVAEIDYATGVFKVYEPRERTSGLVVCYSYSDT